jgi:uncharacterized delta-60 repeat protein
VVSDSVVQPDGKIVLAGWFTTYAGVSRPYIARVLADGSLDTSFNPGTGANNRIVSIIRQPDGKFLIGGQFTTYGGTSRNYIARLESDGSLDTAFDPGTGFSAQTNDIALQADGKVIAAGNFTSFNGTGRNRLARLNGDGSLDTAFNVGAGADNTVTALALLPDNDIVIAGHFLNYNGVARNRLARLGN